MAHPHRPIGYIVARDLGDDDLELYVGTGSITKLYGSVAEAHAARYRGGGDPEFWGIYALTDAELEPDTAP